MSLSYEFRKVLAQVYAGSQLNVSVKTSRFYPFLIQFREWKTDPNYDPDFTFERYLSNPQMGWIHISSTRSSLGRGCMFFVVPKDLLHGRRLRAGFYSYGSYGVTNIHIRIFDGAYDAADDSMWPVSWSWYTMGAGKLYDWAFLSVSSYPDWESPILDLSKAQYPYVTVFFCIDDAWIAQNFDLYINYVEIVDDKLGVIKALRFGGFTHPVIMVRTGTTGDYGYLGLVKDITLPSGSPIVRPPYYPTCLAAAVGKGTSPASPSDIDLEDPIDQVRIDSYSVSSDGILIEGSYTSKFNGLISEVGLYAFVKDINGVIYPVLISRVNVSKRVKVGDTVPIKMWFPLK